MKVRFATWNVQGLGARNGVMPPSGPDQEARLQAVADTLKEMGQDPQDEGPMQLSLQEVPCKAALEALVSKYGLDETFPYRRFFKTNDVEGQNHLAELSQVPFKETKSNAGKKFKVEGFREPGHFTRDVAESGIQLGPYNIRSYNTHLKANPQISKHDPEFVRKKAVTDAIRDGESRGFKDIIKENHKRMPTELYVVKMDANSVPQDSTVKRLTGGFAPVHDPLGEQQVGFESHPSSHRRLDYILLSDGLMENVVPGSVEVLNTPTTRRASDHNPMVLTVELPDLPPV